jgi:hypothetical protein
MWRPAYRISCGKTRRKRSLGRPRRRLSTILKWILEKEERVVWTRFM